MPDTQQSVGFHPCTLQKSECRVLVLWFPGSPSRRRYLQEGESFPCEAQVRSSRSGRAPRIAGMSPPTPQLLGAKASSVKDYTAMQAQTVNARTPERAGRTLSRTH